VKIRTSGAFVKEKAQRLSAGLPLEHVTSIYGVRRISRRVDHGTSPLINSRCRRLWLSSTYRTTRNGNCAQDIATSAAKILQNQVGATFGIDGGISISSLHGVVEVADALPSLRGAQAARILSENLAAVANEGAIVKVSGDFEDFASDAAADVGSDVDLSHGVLSLSIKIVWVICSAISMGGPARFVEISQGEDVGIIVDTAKRAQVGFAGGGDASFEFLKHGWISV
jgi:hypothetical protein